MKSAVETLEPTRVKLTVEVPYEELAPSVEAAYKTIAQQVTVPGFRKGKVPARIIDQRFGRAVVIEQAVNDALPGLYRQAVTETGVKPLGQPDVEVTGVPGLTGPGGELTFTAEVDIRPQFELPDLAGLTVTLPSAEVSDDDVEQALESLRVRFATLTGVDRAAEDGDFVVLDLRAEIGEEEIDSVSGISYQIGSGGLLPGLDEALIGLSAGETKTFTAALVGGEHAGEEAQVTVTPTQVKERHLPEVTDEFAELASEFDTVEELRAGLREQAAASRRSAQVGEARDGLIAALLEHVDFPLPASVIEAEVHSHLEGEGRLADEVHRAEVTEEATGTLRRQILLDALAERLGVGVAQGELIEFLVTMSRQYNLEPGEFIARADRAGQIPVWVGELARTKAITEALRQVTVVSDDGTPVDPDDLLGPAEPTEPTEEPEGSPAAAGIAESDVAEAAETPVEDAPAR